MSEQDIIAKLDELIAVQRVHVSEWLDAEGVGALLSQKKRYVLERLAPLPDFPRPTRRGQPRWKKSEVLEWWENQRKLNQAA